MHASQTKQRVNKYTVFHGQVDVQMFSTHNACLGRQMPSPQCPSYPLPEPLLVHRMLYVMGHAFGQLSPSNLLPIPAHWPFRGEGAGEKALILGKCCSAVAKTLFIINNTVHQRCRALHPTGRYEEHQLHPHQPRPALQFHCKYWGQWRHIRTTAVLPVDFANLFSLQVFFASVRSGGSSQVYFMTLGRTSLLSW